MAAGPDLVLPKALLYVPGPKIPQNANEYPTTKLHDKQNVVVFIAETWCQFRPLFAGRQNTSKSWQRTESLLGNGPVTRALQNRGHFWLKVGYIANDPISSGEHKNSESHFSTKYRVFQASRFHSELT